MIGNMVKLKEEEEEAKRLGKSPIKSKVGPYIHGKASRVGGPVIQRKTKKSVRGDKSSAHGSSGKVSTGKESNDRLSLGGSRQGISSKHSLASGDKRTRAEISK